MAKGKIPKLLSKLYKKSGGYKFGGWDIINEPFSYPAYLDAAGQAKRDLGGLNKIIGDLNNLARVNRKARKDIFFRKKLADAPNYGPSSWFKNRQANWERKDQAARTDVALDVINDIFGRKKKLRKELFNTPDTNENWMKRWSLDYDLKKVSEQEKIAKGHFRRFKRSPPDTRPLKELKNMSRSDFTKMTTEATNSREVLGDYANQGNYLEFNKGHVGFKLRNLKKIRKELAKEIAPNPKRSLIDYKINKRAEGVKFVRINGRIVPIRPKK